MHMYTRAYVCATRMLICMFVPTSMHLSVRQCAFVCMNVIMFLRVCAHKLICNYAIEAVDGNLVRVKEM